jgi:membrane protease YdiL (CAAX protease family)
MVPPLEPPVPAGDQPAEPGEPPRPASDPAPASDLPGAGAPPPEGGPTLGRALAVLGVTVALTLLVFGLFYVFQPRAHRDVAMLWFSAAQSIAAVLLPTAIAFFWPRTGAPGRLPSYAPPRRAVIAGVFFVSLPLYALSAAMLYLVGAWDPARPAPGTPAAAAPAVPTAATLAGLWLVLAALPAIAEELMYRGMIQPAIAQRWGPVWGIGVTAVLFSSSHMEPAGFVPRVLMGAWFGYLAWRTRSLWASTWAHALNNTWGVALLAGMAYVTPHPFVVAVLALASLATGIWCLERAGWLGPQPEAPSALVAVGRLKETTTAPDGPAPEA